MHVDRKYVPVQVLLTAGYVVALRAGEVCCATGSVPGSVYVHPLDFVCLSCDAEVFVRPDPFQDGGYGSVFVQSWLEVWRSVSVPERACHLVGRVRWLA